MKTSTAWALTLGAVGLSGLVLLGVESARLYRAYRAAPDRDAIEFVARAFGQDRLVNAGLRAAERTAGPVPLPVAPMTAKTVVSTDGDRFLINGIPTYQGRSWNGTRVEGLLLNSRMVQATFDDWAPDAATHWAYPDTGVWDPDRNTAEFIAAMPTWHAHGLLGITVNLQGGNAHGRHERWVNSAFDASGELHPAHFDRMRAVIQKADELGMVVILGLFYFRNDEVLRDETAVRTAVDRTVDWLHNLGARNVLIEVNNECDIPSYDHAILRCDRVHELIERVAGLARNGYRFLVSTSLRGGSLPSPALVKSADFILLHGNGVGDPRRIAKMAEAVRAGSAYRPMPLVFNEDDHYGFDRPINNFTAATQAFASWGYLDLRGRGEPFEAGFQNMPVDWRISHERKRAFFALLAEITGANPSAVRQ